MANIKLHQELTVVLTKDGDIYRTLTPLQEFCQICEKAKFVLIDWIMINTYDIKKAYPMKADDVDTFILSQDREVIKKIRERQKEMDLAIPGKDFNSVKSVISWLESKGIEYTNI